MQAAIPAGLSLAHKRVPQINARVIQGSPLKAKIAQKTTLHNVQVANPVITSPRTIVFQMNAPVLQGQGQPLQVQIAQKMDLQNVQNVHPGIIWAVTISVQQINNVVLSIVQPGGNINRIMRKLFAKVRNAKMVNAAIPSLKPHVHLLSAQQTLL